MKLDIVYPQVKLNCFCNFDNQPNYPSKGTLLKETNIVFDQKYCDKQD